MIRRALDVDIPNEAFDETLIRIVGLKKAYGCDVPFIQFYTDENHGLLSIMDGVGLLSVDKLTDEWRIFLLMNSDIHVLHCAGSIGRDLLNDGDWQGRVGVVMRYDSTDYTDADVTSVCVSPYLPDVYTLLDTYFPNMISFNNWYPDASHRVRHGCCHIGSVVSGDRVISSAMTVAESDTAAIIGQVATHQDFRKQGLAGKCINAVIQQCKGKSLYILPIHENAARLYHKLGFVPSGEWAELNKL